MTPAMIETARALVEDPRWEWGPIVPGRGYGMLTADGNRILWDHGPDTPFLRGTPLDEIRADAIPDLTDDATAGVILGMLPLPYQIKSPSGEQPGDGGQLWRVVVQTAITGGSRASGHHADHLAHAAGLAWLATGEQG